MITEEKITFVPLIRDQMFKFIFGYQKNVRFTSFLMEALENVEWGTYKDKIKVTNSFNYEKLKYNMRSYETDVLIEMPNGEKVVLEAQTSWSMVPKIKNLIYLCLAFGQQFEVGEKLDTVKRTREYNFIKSLVKSKEYGIMSVDKERQEYIDGLFRLITINIVDGKRYECNERLKDILRLMNAETEEEAREIVKGKEILEDMFQEMKRFVESGVAEELFSHDGYLRALGREEGKKERNIELAKKMIAKNKPIKEIREFTGLSQETLIGLMEEADN